MPGPDVDSWPCGSVVRGIDRVDPCSAFNHGLLEAVRAQEAYLGDRGRFLPSNGCPGPELLDLPEAEPLVRLVILDTQWWLHRGRKPTDACDPGTAAGVAEALREALDTELAVVVAAHHPLATYGRHGGFYDWRAHLFPLTHLARWLWIPLPGAGSVYSLVRSRVIRSGQDLSGLENQVMREVLTESLASREGNGLVLYVAGHEHSLQVLRGGVVDYMLISGAGSPSKITAVTNGPNTVFAHEHAGFMSLDVTATAIRLSVVEPAEAGDADVVFSLDMPLIGD